MRAMLSLLSQKCLSLSLRRSVDIPCQSCARPHAFDQNKSTKQTSMIERKQKSGFVVKDGFGECALVQVFWGALFPVFVPSFRFFRRPQTCVYPDVCLGIAHVSGKAPLPGQGVW